MIILLTIQPSLNRVYSGRIWSVKDIINAGFTMIVDLDNAAVMLG